MDYLLGVIVILGIVLRCMVSLHPYSGIWCGVKCGMCLVDEGASELVTRQLVTGL